MRRTAFLVLLSTVPAAVAATVVSPPARAACVTASVWVNRYHSTPTYVVGPDQCVVPTPFPPGGGAGDDEHEDHPSMTPGQPNGAGFWIGVPSPVMAQKAAPTRAR